MNNTNNNVNSTFPKTHKNAIYVELHIYQFFMSHILC